MFRRRDRNIPLDEKWFNSLKRDLEESYLRYPEPWKQAGFLMGEEAWEPCRKPIADCIQKSGSFLDIGCANGYLLESIIKWTSYKIAPYGIDLSAKLIELAKDRLAQYNTNLFTGSAPGWTNPVKFDYVRTDMGYVLDDSQEQYLHKVLTNYLEPDGRLLITEYRSPKEPAKTPWLNEKIQRWEFNIIDQKAGFYGGKELTRVLVIGH